MRTRFAFYRKFALLLTVGLGTTDVHAQSSSSTSIVVNAQPAMATVSSDEENYALVSDVESISEEGFIEPLASDTATLAPADNVSSPMGVPPLLPPSIGASSDCGSSVSSLWEGSCTDGSACTTGSCGSGLFPGSCDGTCGGRFRPCTHTSGAFGELLYLRARNAEVAYAEPINGPIVAPPSNNPIQVGRIASVDPDYDTGFRVGFSIALDDCSSVQAAFTKFDSHTNDRIATAAPDVIRSLVSHPSSLSAATDFLQGAADYDIDFETVDVDFRHLWHCGCNFEINYMIGVRYANMDQEFDATFVNNGSEDVATRIGYDGGGIRFGLDGVRYACAGNWHVYGKGTASFVAGEFRGSYQQGQSFDPTVVQAHWDNGRVVSILDAEAGFAWLSNSGRVRATIGYVVSAWFNSVKTDEFIRSVQTSDFVDLSDNLSFDGLISRVEVRF